ncbi:class I SAM-dependent methyltransferase [Brevibacterium casei]|uniref:class I SAM-dependent methyltransferase n=1 Tax=Brevibacterium casei TaxID=33889 RepID=UPI00092A6AD4|nr:class I SAM-dependent methyltransferase [Brevibacterium casei]MCT2184640.1 class I SAM-dependent methyltransferase [Brevibacterium casei]SIK36107.1 methyltransferasemethylase [Mycobacteroides abscessus subsp. abscessus]
MTNSSNLGCLQSNTERARQNARRWYSDPALVPTARKHDAEVEPRYSKFIASEISGFGTRAPTIIDIGCGEGLLAKTFTSFRKYIGVDPDCAELHTEATPSSDSVEFVRAGIENLPSTVPSADIVVSSLNIALWDDPSERCAQLRRLLNPEGHILIVDLLRTGPCIQHTAADELNQFLIDQYNASFTDEEVASLCQSSLPGAEVTTYTDERDGIVPFASDSSNFGKLFLIHFQEA